MPTCPFITVASPLGVNQKQCSSTCALRVGTECAFRVLAEKALMDVGRLNQKASQVPPNADTADR